MVDLEQRHKHGPDKIVKQEYVHFITLIHQQTSSIRTISLSLHFIYDFVSLSVMQ